MDFFYKDIRIPIHFILFKNNINLHVLDDNVQTFPFHLGKEFRGMNYACYKL